MDPRDALQQLKVRAAALRRRDPRRIERPWPKGWDLADLERLATELWGALTDAAPLGPSASSEWRGRTGDSARAAADGAHGDVDGILVTAGEYGAVPGDAVFTLVHVIHRDALVVTSHVSDCTMTSLTVEVHAPSDRADALAAALTGLLPDTGNGSAAGPGR